MYRPAYFQTMRNVVDSSALNERTQERDGVVDETQLLEDGVERADRRRVEAVEEQRRGRQAERHRQKEDGAQHAHPAPAFLHQQGQAKAHPDEQDGDEHGVLDGEHTAGTNSAFVVMAV